jgi:pimeloyl-ACP methyl ester carboxylesterase
MRSLYGALVTVLMLAAMPGGGLASDRAKEQRWAEQIVDALIDGEAVWLDADGHAFLGIYTEAPDGGSGRAAILAHGIGVHPNWPQVIYPLRTRLPGHGWATLSLQMPVLPNEAQAADYAPLFAEVGPRMEAGLAFLREQGMDEVVIVGHSLGAGMSIRYLADAHPPIRGLVAVGMSGTAGAGPLSTLDALEAVSVPLLDIFGSEDLPPVRGTAAERRRAAGAGYEQVVVVGADHFFEGREDALLDRVLTWLNRTVPAD